MAKIPLRTYNREIESMIDRGQAAQAIDHGQHILKFFPKHIDTYRLLGKAFLELQKHPEAADVLQRVLSCVPDDFISQVGMGIIREEEGNLDAAIWHMERAFEAQPSNVGVQDELRRLYGKRDGVQPVKIRLTRGALVRMYARGELFQQAIAEIRAALVEDPQRVDLEVILARMYFLSGQKVAATEVCTRLLNKLPFCFEANRILAKILPESARAEDAKNYLQRVYAMDPYLEHISTSAPTTAEVPDNAIEVEKLEWLPGQEAEPMPDWSKALGIDWKDQAEPVPDWVLSGGQEPEKPPEPEPDELPQAESDLSESAAPELAQEFPAEEQLEEGLPLKEGEETEIPDWMKEAGWTPASGEIAEAPQSDFASEETGVTDSAPEIIDEAEIPDWLAAMAPPEPTEETGPADAESVEWLDTILPAAGEGAAAAVEQAPQEEPIQSDEATQSAGEEVLPLIESAPDAEAAAAESLGEPAEFKPGIETPEEIEELASPMEFLADEITEPPTEEEISAPPAFLAEEIPEMPSDEEIQTPSAFPTEESAATSGSEELPSPRTFLTEEPAEAQSSEEPQFADWLANLEPSRGEPTAEGPIDTGGWINELTSEEPEESAEISESDLPDWLVEASTASGSEESRTNDAPVNLGDTQPTRIKRDEHPTPEFETPQEETSAEPEIDESMSWLDRLTAHEGGAEEFQDAISKEPEEDIFEATSADESLAARSELPEAEEGFVSEEEGSFTTPETLGEQPENADQIAEFGLEELIPSEESSESQVETVESAFKEHIPEMNIEEPEAAQGLSPAEMGDEAAFAWLDALAANQAAEEETAEPSAEKQPEDIPDWFKEVVETPEPGPVDTPEQEQFLASFEGTSEQSGEGEPEQTETPAEVPSFELDAEPVQSEGIPEPTESIVEQTQPEWAVESSELAPEQEPTEEPLPDWLKAVVAEEEPIAETTPVESPLAEEPTAEEALGWLQDIANEEEPLTEVPAGEPDIEDTSPLKIPSAFTEEESILEPAEPGEAEALPDWLLGVDDEKAAEEPLQEFTLEGEPAEITSESLEPGWKPEMPAESSLEEPPPIYPAVETSSDQPADMLRHAQEALDAHNIDRALEHYDRLIQSGQHLDETIHDLRDALYRYPIDAAIWQSLGDAYMKSNHLQDALDAYTKAEELLR